MAGKRHDDGRVCLCDRPDGTCAGLAVQRLSRDRVRDLAEEIWTASSGFLPPVRPAGDPRSSRPGASARAAFLRRREQERGRWRPGSAWRWWVVAGAALRRRAADRPDRRRVAGLAAGPGDGGAHLVAAALSTLGQRQRLAPPGRHAAPHRRRAGAAGAGGVPGAARRHPAGLAGQPGPSAGRRDRGVGDRVLAAPAAATGRQRPARDRARAALPGRRRRRGPGRLGRVPVRSLLCVHSRWLGSPRSFQGGLVADPRQLVEVVRCGSRWRPTRSSGPPPGCSRCCERRPEP